MLALGFAAGLPAVLVFDVLSLWLRASGVSLEAIGFFSLVGLAYSLKFLWAPLLDRVQLPLLSIHLGRRRAWMLACQLPIVLGLWLMSTADPTRGLSVVAALAVLVVLLSATQDIAIDAWRIEFHLWTVPGRGSWRPRTSGGTASRCWSAAPCR